MTFAVLMVILATQRAFVYFFCVDASSSADGVEVIKAFGYGIRFDLVITSMLMIPLPVALLLINPRHDGKRSVKFLLSTYCGLAAAIVVVAGIADFYFFQEFGKRLNSQIFIYARYDYIYSIIMESYPYVTIVLVAMGSFAITVWLSYRCLSVRRYVGAGSANIVWLLFIVMLLTLGIRGSFGPKAINLGPAYFSDSKEINQLTLNGLFTLREAARSLLSEDARLNDQFSLLPEVEAFAVAKDIFMTPADSFSENSKNPLWRTTDTGQPQKDHNVVLVIMESLSWQYIEAMGGVAGLTPNLNELIEHGIFMDHCFSVGHRTTYGLTGIVCGYPDMPTASVSTLEPSVGNFLTLGTVLKNRGYNTMFVYGGQPHYDHRQSFLASNGFEEFIFEERFPQKTMTTHLGWCDEDLYAAAHHAFEQQDKPFFATLLTLSFHRDYKVPAGRVTLDAAETTAREQKLTIKYADWALGQFIDQARQSEYFNKTIFVFVADHSGGYLKNEPNPTSFRVPFLIYAPEIIGQTGQRISKICSQTDVSPTIMSLLGGSYSHSFFGSSTLHQADNGFGALVHAGDGTLAYIDTDSCMAIIPPTPNKQDESLFNFAAPDKLKAMDTQLPLNSQRLKRLEREAIALLQTAKILYDRQSYKCPYPGELKP